MRRHLARTAIAAMTGLLIAGPLAAEDWTTYGRTLDNQRYSPLDQINRGTVKRLTPAWIYQTGITGTFQTSPLIAGGVMYLTTPKNHVIALDAATGEPIWRYRHEMAVKKLCCGPANKGAAMGHGMIFTTSADGRLIALDQATGAVKWDVTIAELDSRPTERPSDLAPDDPRRELHVQGSSGLGANMAPIVFEDLVIAGVTGAGYGLHVTEEEGKPVSAVIGFEGRFGRRGYLAAFEAKTGKEVWRWYTTKSGGWEGEWRTETPDGAPLHRDIAEEKRNAAKHADAWQVGGGSLWSSPAIDAELGLLYLGTGNPAPQLDDVSRPGDNLHTVSVVALDVRTGELKWHYQQVPHDLWGYDAASPPVLFELQHEGRTIKAVGQASKTGWMYVNDRVTGELIYRSDAFVPQSNIFQRPSPEGIVIAPGAAGGVSWSPTAHDPQTGMSYVAAIHMPTRYTVHQRPAAAGKPALRYSSLEILGEERAGTLSAIDTRRGGRLAWQVETSDILVGGVLATAGGLVFMGEGTGQFAAFDSASGERLWQFASGAGVNAPPVTYSIGGRQYVAVAAGGHIMFGFPTGNAVIAFALPE